MSDTPETDQLFWAAQTALRRSLSVPVMLDHGEALKLVVCDLAAKYRHNVERGDTEWAEVFHKALSYYLTPEELTAINFFG